MMALFKKKWLKSKAIYKNINNVFRESNKFVAPTNDNYFSNLAVINGFMRPAEITEGSIARVLGIGKDTVTKTLKKRKKISQK